MKRFLILILFNFLVTTSFSQINTDLKKELDAILQSDQLLREYSDSNISNERKLEIVKISGFSKEELDKNLWGIINKQDSINLLKVENIISKHGYPGKTLVGKPTNEAAWYVIQHSREIPKYFSLIEAAGKNGEIPMTLVAMMKDRMLMYQGKEQIYGTQGTGRFILNEKNEEVFFGFIWPIKNPKKVNTLRKSIGFKNTVEDYSKELGIIYTVFTLKDYEKLHFVEKK